MDMKRRWYVYAMALSAIACRPDDRHDDLSPTEAKELNPSGTWVRQSNSPIQLTIYRDPEGAWIAESSGNPPAGQAQNACRNVYAGVLNNGEMILSSDLDRDFHGRLSRDDIGPYNGMLLVFKRGAVVVSGPEAETERCPASGTYIRQN